MCMVDFLPCLYLAAVLVSHLWVMQNFSTSFTPAAPPPKFSWKSHKSVSWQARLVILKMTYGFLRRSLPSIVFGGTVCINGEIRPVLTLNGKLPQRAEEKSKGLGRGYGGWGQTRWKNNISTGRYIFPHHFLCLFFSFVSNPLIFPMFFCFYNPRW